MTRLIFCAVLMGLMTGCSSVKSFLPGGSNTSPGDQMMSQAKETKTLGKTWNDGKDLVKKGQKLMSKSEKLALESRKARTEAEGLIAKGNTLISSSERTYETAFGETPGSMSGGSMTR